MLLNEASSACDVFKNGDHHKKLCKHAYARNWKKIFSLIRSK